MNKYKKEARKAAKARRRDKMCERKRAYNSESEAREKNSKVYLCPYCKKWHRSGSFRRLVRKVSRGSKR